MEPVSKSVRLLILDVDGVLTDGSLPYGAAGSETKQFHVRDGGAIRLWRELGGTVAFLSGRSSEAVSVRAKELRVETVVQGAVDKLPPFLDLCRRFQVDASDVCYVGDDWADMAPMRRSGWPVAVADALPAVKRIARYVTRAPGGRGAIAEVVERLLRAAGRWDEAVGRAGPGSSGECRGD